MTVETFLSFWSQHNTVIIEGLVGLVVFLSLFLAFRSFFGKKEETHGEANHGNLDTAQLEKTLQKILDNQSHQTKPAKSEDLDLGVELEGEQPAAAPAASSEAGVEAAQMKVFLADSQKKIETLQAQLKEAQTKATEAVAAAASAPAAASGGGDNGASAELSAKIKDLEARLSEYEIISEDIADLSRFREENEELRKQLDGFQKAAGSAATAQEAPAPVQAAPEPTPSFESAPPVELESAFADASAGQTPTEPAIEPVVESAMEPAAEAPAADAGSELIDDELMKEFAAAVEGQKAATSAALETAAEKAGDGAEASKKVTDESEKLMNEFENFVAKKS